MAPVPASIPAAPSWNSALTVSIGDKKQTIVYTAILVSFIVIFVTGLVYVLRVYITSSVDEESNTSRPPRPPLRIFIPGGSQQCAQSSTSTLVGGGAPPEASQPPFKRSGSGPSPLVCSLCVQFTLSASHLCAGPARAHRPHRAGCCCR